MCAAWRPASPSPCLWHPLQGTLQGTCIDSGCGTGPLKALAKLKALSSEAGRFGGEVAAPFRHVIPQRSSSCPSPPGSPFLSACPQVGIALSRKDGIGGPLHFCRVFRFRRFGGLASWRPGLPLGSRMFIPVSWLYTKATCGAGATSHGDE